MLLILPETALQYANFNVKLERKLLNVDGGSVKNVVSRIVEIRPCKLRKLYG